MPDGRPEAANLRARIGLFRPKPRDALIGGKPQNRPKSAHSLSVSLKAGDSLKRVPRFSSRVTERVCVDKDSRGET